MKGRILPLSLLLIAAFLTDAAEAQTVYFDDSSQDVMVVGNDSYYEFAFSKTSGAIVGITDKATGTLASSGSLEGSLWAIVSHDNWSYASEYSDAGPSVFSYVWAAGTQTLTLSYQADPETNSHPLTVVVTVSPSELENLDMSISVTNNEQRELSLVSFPHYLMLELGTGDSVLLPVGYPGMLLESEYFSSADGGDEPYDVYNGLWHADWVGIHLDGTDLSMYSLRDGLPLIGTQLGIKRSYVSPDFNFSYAHEYQTWLSQGETFVSPATRFLVGKDFGQSLQAYREDNGIDEFPSLQDKLGDRFSDFAASPLIYHPFGEGAWQLPYAEIADYVEFLPNPSLIMLSWYWEGDFEGNHPDYVPPDPRWGATEDFIQMVADIKNQGRLAMPFTLPIWWHENSREITQLPAGKLTDISVITIEGLPSYSNWGPNWGYDVSPCSNYTLQRIEQIYTDIFDTYGADVIYQDVVGARPTMWDFNPDCPYPTSYGQAIIDQLDEHSDVPIVVEAGFDRLAKSTVGFMGTLMDKENTPPVSPFGPLEGWRPYPTAPVLYHDKVISYPFWNGYPTKYEISFNLHFGVPLTEWMANPWTPGFVPLLRDFSQRILARMIGKQMTDYEDLARSVSQSTFEDISVIWNRSDETPFEVDSHTLPPMGSLVTSTSGDLVGGILTGFNGEDLSAGDHYLVVEYAAELITVRHPLGVDSPISLTYPIDWINESLIRVYAVTPTGKGLVNHTVSAGKIHFTMQERVNGELVERFEVIEVTRLIFADGFESEDVTAGSGLKGGAPSRRTS